MAGWIAAVVLACVLVVLVTGYERELRRMARFLSSREKGGNERVTVGFSTPGIASVASAVNGEMDMLRDERAAVGRRQAEFRRELASLSHDIRTPLAGAQGYLQLYERSRDVDERARCLSEAASRLCAMRDLTDSLFEYARASESDVPLDLERVEILPVLADALASAYPQFAERGWEPQVDFEDEDASVLADAAALERVFSNLVSNFLRYGADAPRIVQRGSSLSFSNRVRNSGALDPSRLFERFYRADGARSGDGSGLGLSIVAGLCGRMGTHAGARLEGDVLVITLHFPET